MAEDTHICEGCGEPFSRTIKQNNTGKYYCTSDCYNTSKKPKTDWEEVQRLYDSGLSQREICKYLQISGSSVYRAVKSGKLTSRSLKDARKLVISKGKNQKTKLIGLGKYRLDCSFKFSLNEFPSEFDFTLIERLGWYHPVKNPKGVSRDHIISVKYGFINKIDPLLLSHPANCKIMPHTENSSKKSKCGMTICELNEKITAWDCKYGKQ